MTIQISLVIWTIIGFVVLSLILNRFLFKPLLKVMDDRNEKIKAGAEKRRTELEHQEKNRKALEIANAAHEQEAIKAAQNELDNERKKTETILADKKAEYDAELEKISKEFETDTAAAEKNLSESIEKLALKYVKTQIL